MGEARLARPALGPQPSPPGQTGPCDSPKKCHRPAAGTATRRLCSRRMAYYLYLPGGFPDWAGEDDHEAIARLTRHPLLGVYTDWQSVIEAYCQAKRQALERIWRTGRRQAPYSSSASPGGLRPMTRLVSQRPRAAAFVGASLADPDWPGRGIQWGHGNEVGGGSRDLRRSARSARPPGDEGRPTDSRRRPRGHGRADGARRETCPRRA